VETLEVTGPVLGVMEEPFGVRTVYLEDGDTLVLATDGLTEARDANGEFLNASGAMELIGRAKGHPQELADGLIHQIRLRSGNAIRDDVAILAIRVHEAREASTNG
jgi:serine phosphatase RsbU (regulator of sigma subunit)